MLSAANPPQSRANRTCNPATSPAKTASNAKLSFINAQAQVLFTQHLNTALDAHQVSTGNVCWNLLGSIQYRVVSMHPVNLTL